MGSNWVERGRRRWEARGGGGSTRRTDKGVYPAGVAWLTARPYPSCSTTVPSHQDILVPETLLKVRLFFSFFLAPSRPSELQLDRDGGMLFRVSCTDFVCGGSFSCLQKRKSTEQTREAKKTAALEARKVSVPTELGLGFVLRCHRWTALGRKRRGRQARCGTTAGRTCGPRWDRGRASEREHKRW